MQDVSPTDGHGYTHAHTIEHSNSLRDGDLFLFHLCLLIAVLSTHGFSKLTGESISLKLLYARLEVFPVSTHRLLHGTETELNNQKNIVSHFK